MNGAPSGAESMVSIVQKDYPQLQPAVEWIKTNGGDPTAIVNAALEYLRARGRHLPAAQRRRYAARTIMSEFFARWGAKNKNSSVTELKKDPARAIAELRPFRLTIMAAGDARAFERVVGKLARVKKCGGMIGDAENFSAFLSDNDIGLAHRFLRNFDPNVAGANRKSLTYIETMAASFYLQSRAVEARDDSGLAGHLARSKKLHVRTKLAAKLAYMPALLTQADRDLLRDEYGLKRLVAKRMMVKDVAALLRFKSAAVLSRKLYRLRKWVPADYEAQPIEVKF